MFFDIASPKARIRPTKKTWKRGLPQSKPIYIPPVMDSSEEKIPELSDTQKAIIKRIEEAQTQAKAKPKTKGKARKTPASKE